ncbi:nucleotide synthetase [Novosphingobium sp.]|uniref:nucleotide synthetase n=1 Tax=Novosphingobium sp. TaxID=1874826 RepID=UPI0027370D07|nr:nucleotide synthetase [Novosphingobium sp.]MDP3907705.1 hypothetical protein [Novosphingobium sp.]
MSNPRISSNEDELPVTGQPAEGAAVKQAIVRFGMLADGAGAARNLAVTMQDEGPDKIVGGDQTMGFSLNIKPGEHWQIVIRLAGDWNWTFDDSPISFKQAGQARYYQYVSQTADTLTFTARSRYDTPNPPVQQPERHHFNLYVEIGQSGALKNGFRIDPEVRNPPPND